MKTLIFLLGYILYPFSFVVPRSKKKWSFGSFRGAFNDNSKYLFIYVSNNYPEITTSWISADKNTVKQVRSIGFKAYNILSIRGLWFALSSKYWFFNAYTSDILFFASGKTICINLWHGVGPKKVEFGITSGKLTDRYVRKTFKEYFYFPFVYRRPDYFLSSTVFQSEKFAKEFRISTERCLNLGYPRNEILVCSEKERIDFINKYESQKILDLINKLSGYNKVYIYMPTWRDSQKDIFSTYLDAKNIDKIMIESNSLFIIKAHANTFVTKELFSQYENIFCIDNTVDVYPILPYTDVLITDYSSILYDYILMENKDIILYIYDYEEYADMLDSNFQFYDNVVGKKVNTFSELCDTIEKKTYQIDEEKRQKIILKFWGNKNANVCKKIIGRIYN
jgi:CDP-glycerol glycerophosphotransferase (TagB/SpsB family)